MAHQEVLRSLKILFGDIPNFIRENVKYLSYNDERDDFTCAPCDKIIKKSSIVFHTTENLKKHLFVSHTTENFKKHLYSNLHENNSTISTNELTQQLSTFFGKVPPIILMNAEKLSVNGTDYKCVICEKNIRVNNNNISVTETNFLSHLLSFGHEKKLEDFSETLGQLSEIYGGISLTILNHSRFLIKNGIHYLCTICDKQLMVHPTDVKETEKCFEQHLHSLKHIRNAKQTKAFSLIPELEIIFSSLPNYMLRNMEYISINGLNFFCSLCSENIKFNRHDPYETELNFKLHILSTSHEENLEDRRDQNNEVFNRLYSLFEEFPGVVLKNLKYLTVNENDFYCEICEVTIKTYDEQEQTNESLVLHFESLNHENMVSFKHGTASEARQDLNDVFGTIPEKILDNLKHIEFKNGKNFECILCNEILQTKSDSDYDDNTSVTESNFLKHLDSNGHEAQLEEIEEINNDLESDLQDIFNPVPQYVMNNLHHLSYDSDNFKCILCDRVITVVPGNKKAELTEQNFRNHFLSVGHFAKLKHKANLLMDATEKLELIFNKIPNFIVSNIQHIEVQDNHYYCTLCDAKIMAGGAESTEKQFRQHLFGSSHRYNLKNIDNENDEAFQRLDQEFWRIPEFILRNIDFLQTDENDLFCLLCQERLPIDEEDLIQTKESLRDHIDSERHQFSLKSI